MIVAVHQPHYFPWAGYLDKMDTADVFVLLDTVQYEKNGWQNRNRIKTAQGWQWLTVPVLHRFGTPISDIRIENRSGWAKKHRKTLAAGYARAPYYSRYTGWLDDVYGREWERLDALNGEMLAFLAGEIGVKTPVVRASALGDLPGDPNERLAAMVRRLGGDVYLAGSGCGDYLRREVFEDSGVEVIFQDFHPTEYPQFHGDFVPGLAVFDLLLNCGEDSLGIIRKGRRTVL